MVTMAVTVPCPVKVVQISLAMEMVYVILEMVPVHALTQRICLQTALYVTVVGMVQIAL